MSHPLPAPASRLHRFFFPHLSWRYGLRVAAIALLTWFTFTRILVPVRIHNISMEPTYHAGDVHICWRARYWFREPRHGDLVAVRFAGPRTMLLKRVVGLPGDTIEFRDGILYRNAAPQNEPYVTLPCNWNMPPRHVELNRLYVVGDNRSIPIDDHYFGQTERHRVIGTVY